MRPSPRSRSPAPSRRRAALAVLPVAAALACGDTASPPTPAEMLAVEGDGQEAVVGTALPAPLVVRVVDDAGEPVAGVGVAWAAEADAGSVSPSTGETGPDGRASAAWTLGTRAGPAAATATVTGLPALPFRATARSGPAADVRMDSGDGQRAPVGEPLPDPLRVRVEDAWGNPVEDVPVAWTVSAGAVEDPAGETDGDGVASAVWNVGREAGPREAVATVQIAAGEPPREVRFSAVADPTALNLTVENVYLVQASQRWAGDVPLLRGRAGLLRVFVRASVPTEQRPSVRVRLRDAGGSVVEERVIDAPIRLELGGGVAEEPLGRSYNVLVPGHVVQPGFGIDVRVDPDDRVAETDEDDNGLPGAGAGLAPTVVEAPPFGVTFVPLRVNGAVGDPESRGVELLLWDAQRMHPLVEVDADVRDAPLDLSQFDLRESGDWPRMVATLLAARVADGTERYYYGLVPPVEGMAWGGYALIGQPSAVGVDNSSGLVAHELGHNWGRPHAPGCDALGTDQAYPYPGGSIGVYGYDSRNRTLQRPSSRWDLMSYCSPQWVSDYTWESVLAFRAAEAEEALRAGPRTPREVLIVWGRVEADSLVLEPAFRATAPPVLPDAPGPMRIRGMDAQGTSLFDLRFRPAPLEHGPEGDGVFAFAVPLDAARSVATLRLEDGARATELRVPAGAGAPDASAERLDEGRVRVRWDAEAYPMVVVRDPTDGTVLSFARGGDAVVHTGRPGAVELVPSTGVDGRALPPRRR